MSEPSEVSINTDDNSAAKTSAWALPAELLLVEAGLRRLTPRDDRLDRDRLMFLAGQASPETASSHRTRVMGLRVDSRAWPAAFAGMSAVAAVLAVMLVLRSDHVAQSPQANVVQTDSTRFSRAGESDHPMLTTRDAHLGDIDRLFVQKEMLWPDAGDPAAASAEDHGVPILTPVRWHDVLN
jgi:hypothetical protein